MRAFHGARVGEAVRARLLFASVRARGTRSLVRARLCGDATVGGSSCTNTTLVQKYGFNVRVDRGITRRCRDIDLK